MACRLCNGEGLYLAVRTSSYDQVARHVVFCECGDGVALLKQLNNGEEDGEKRKQPRQGRAARNRGASVDAAGSEGGAGSGGAGATVPGL